MLVSVAIVFFLVFSLWYMGVFLPVRIEEKEIGSWVFLARVFKGSYSAAGQHFKQFQEELKKQYGIEGTLFGAYYDDPSSVPKGECRYLLGVLLDSSAVQGLDKNVQNKDTKLIHWNFDKALVWSFPYRNMLSVFIGMIKFYPALRKIPALPSNKQGHTAIIERYGNYFVDYILPLQIDLLSTYEDFKDLS